MKPTHILLTTLILTALLCAAPVAADAVTYSGKTYTTYDQIYESKTLSSSEKLQLVQTMAGWTEELEAYMEWKNSGGLEAYQAAVSGGNSTNSTSTSSDYGWNEAPGDGLGEGGNIEPEYSYQERQAYDAAYAAYQQEFAQNYAATAAYTGSGSGTQADPYIITTPAELQSINDDLMAYYKLGNDIELPHSAIGSFNTPFNGVLDGSGFKLYGDGSNYATSAPPSFMFLGSSGILKNTHFYDITISTSGDSQGFINGYTGSSSKWNVGLIQDCIFDTFTVMGRQDVGLICYVDKLSNVILINSDIQCGYSGQSYVTRYHTALYYGNNAETYTGITENTVILSTSFYNYPGAPGSYLYDYRVSFPSGTVSNCYVGDYTGVGGSSAPTANGYDGETITANNYNSESWWKSTMSMWDWENVWQWNDETNLPELRNANNQAVSPTISAVSVSPTVGGQETTYTLSTSATTTGQGGISGYQWYAKIGSSGSWQAINGATSATYSFVPGSYAVGDFWFKVVVAGADGGVTDSYDVGFTNVKATIVLAPQITSPAATPAEGPLTQTVQLSASVTSTETATYQWEEQISGSWQAISGATSATSTVTVSDSAATTHSYRLIASNVGGSSTSSTVTYTSVAVPSISAVSASPSSGPLSQSVTLSATVSGATSLQWEEQISGTWTAISGATSATSTVTVSDSAATTHSYRLIASNIGGSSTSSTVTYLSVVPPTISAISTTPASGPLSETIQLSATVTGATSYQWQELIGGNWQNIQGATSATHTQTINDQQPTLHTYRLIASNVGGTTTSAETTYQSSSGPLITAVSASPTSGPLTQTVTLSVSATSQYTISYLWQERISGNWQDISGATSATTTVSISDTVQTVHSYRVLATDVGGTTPSATVTYSSIAPPVIQGANINPVVGKYTETITLSAEVSGADTYQWQQQSGSTWENISGATTNPWVGTVTVSGDTNYRLMATNGGGSTYSDTIQYTIAGPANIQSLSATPSVITLPGSTTLTATGSNVISWEWQQYTSGVWTPIGYSASITQRFTDAGTYQFRVLATGADGAVVTSETVEVIAGFAPSVSITSPNDGTRYQSGERIPLTATITGTDPTWEWSFGSQNVQTGGNSQTTWVEYGIDGRYTISIRVVSLFGTDEDSITIISGRESRPIATTPPIELESDGIFKATDSLTPNENGMPDITGFIMSMSKPFTDMIGAWFYFVLFAVPYLIIWIRQKNIIIPSILGVLFAAWVLIQLPAAALPAAIALITLSVTGGLYGIYVKLQNR